MTPRQIEIIESTWGVILQYPIEFGITFYNKLFELDPGLRSLFKEDIRSQSEKLISLMTFIVHKLGTSEEFVQDVKALGIRHRGYGVNKIHFISVSIALLWALEKKLGSLWSNESKEAWSSIYNTLSSTMIEAMQIEVEQQAIH